MKEPNGSKCKKIAHIGELVAQRKEKKERNETRERGGFGPGEGEWQGKLGRTVGETAGGNKNSTER